MPNKQSVKRVVRVGSRNSALALKQTNLVMEMLAQRHCDIRFELITMETIGDLILDKELSKIGDKSLFTKELELALQENVVDFVVHSLKDVPTTLSSQFVLACVCERIGSEDAVVMRSGSNYQRLSDLPIGAIVGTSSVRRIAQLTYKYPQLTFASVRGNLHTRLKKLDFLEIDNNGCSVSEPFEAIILAKAGLERLGLQSRVSEVLDYEDCLYAVGQGALACECRYDDLVILKLLSSIHDEKSALTSLSERSLMRRLDGGCSTPIAVKCNFSSDNVLYLRALVMSVDGSKRVEDELEIVLPQEDLDTVMERSMTNGHGSGETSAIERLHVTSDEVDLARDLDSVFTGLKVSPICDIGRLRMAVCQRLGTELAERLLKSGAKTILDAIKKPAGQWSNLAKPNGSYQ